MKKLIPLLSAILLCLCFAACDDDDKILPSEVASTVVASQWRVTYLRDTDTEKTSTFTNYQFTFTETVATSPASGIVEASNGSTNVAGSWKTGYVGEAAKLELSFSLSPFTALSKGWEVTELSATTIKLKNGGTQNLTLESF